MSEQINELVTALAKAQAEMQNAPYNQTNPAFKSKYADLASIRDATIPHLAKNGLALFQMTKLNGDGGMHLVTRLAHSSGQWIEGVYPLPIADRPHVMGSALTYARRYSWAAICGIAAENDDDGNEAQEGSRNGAKSLPALPARKSSAAAKRDKDWEKFEAALRDCQSAREVEKLRAEYMTDVYPMWNVDWRDAATEAFSKRLAEYSQPGNLKQTLQDSLQEALLEPVDDDAATDAQVEKFHECWTYLENAKTLTDLVNRIDNQGYREAIKLVTSDQLAQLRAFYKAQMEALGKAAA